MQYVGQTCRKLKTRFGEHCRKIKKPKKIDTFLYQHFKRTGHSPSNVSVQPLEKLSYDENSSVRFNTIKRFETDLKWIKLLQSASPLGFNDNIYHEGNISKMSDFDVFSLLEFRKRRGKKKMTNVKDVLHKSLTLPLCWRHTVPKFIQDGNTMIEIFTFGSDRENIGPFVRAS